MNTNQASKDNVQAALETAEEKLQQAAEQVSDKTDEIKNRTKELSDDTSDSLSKTMADVEAYVREKPLQAVGIAFAAGFVATVLLRR